MRAIETIATVTEDGKLTAPMPPDVAPGAHRVVVIDEQPAPASAPYQPLALKWPGSPVGRRTPRSAGRSSMVTTDADPLFVDTNILVYATEVRSRRHHAATQA